MPKVKQRTFRLHIAITDAERLEWLTWAERKRQTLSEYVRQCVLEHITRQDKEVSK